MLMMMVMTMTMTMMMMMMMMLMMRPSPHHSANLMPCGNPQNYFEIRVSHRFSENGKSTLEADFVELRTNEFGVQKLSARAFICQIH